MTIKRKHPFCLCMHSKNTAQSTHPYLRRILRPCFEFSHWYQNRRWPSIGFDKQQPTDDLVFYSKMQSAQERVSQSNETIIKIKFKFYPSPSLAICIKILDRIQFAFNISIVSGYFRISSQDINSISIYCGSKVITDFKHRCGGYPTIFISVEIFHRVETGIFVETPQCINSIFKCNQLAASSCS